MAANLVAHLDEWTELAHEEGQVPLLEERRLELEGDAEDGDDAVRQRQVADVDVDHGAHAPPGH